MTTPNPSKQELAIQRIMLTVAGAYGVTGRVYRERTEALARGEVPAIVVYPMLAIRDPDTTCRDSWIVRVHCDIMVGGGPTSGQADPIWSSMHALLMADQSVGGTANGIEPWPRSEGGQPALQWERVEGENQPGVLSTAWLLRVRTMQGDVTQ